MTMNKALDLVRLKDTSNLQLIVDINVDKGWGLLIAFHLGRINHMLEGRL